MITKWRLSSIQLILASIICYGYNVRYGEDLMSFAIQIVNLTKFYGNHVGIQNLNLEVEKGEIFGFLGPNGAGKTTTIRLLLGLLRPNKGQIKILGENSLKAPLMVRSKIGYLPSELNFYESLNGTELLKLLQGLRHSEFKWDIWSERFELDLNKPIRSYSTGMKQKLGLIIALASNPELLILDEPTLGLDPLMQREVYKILNEEREHGKTIFLSSHLLNEVEKICDRVGIVKNGHLVEVNYINDLKNKKVRLMNVFLSRPTHLNDFDFDDVEVLELANNWAQIGFKGNLQKLLVHLSKLPLEDLDIPENTLENTFLEFYSNNSQ